MPARIAPVAIAFALAACAPSPVPAPVAPPPPPPRSAVARPPAPPPAPPAPPPAPLAPKVTGPIGGSTPVIVEAAANDAGWVAVCTATADTNGDGGVGVSAGVNGKLTGDALSAQLVVGDGAPEAVDEIAAVDASGRWLVVKKVGKLWLVDARSRTETVLAGADARDDATPYAHHRAVDFDAAGGRLMWVRRGTKGSDVMVRNLDTSAEARVDPGPGKLWRADLSPDGQLVVLHMIVDDTNNNGKLGWPVPERKLNDWRCHGPVATYNAWLDRGDTPVVKVAPSSGGAARTVPGFVAPFGAAVITRDAAGRLLLDRGSGAPVELEDAKCAARVLHADPERGLVVAACSGAKQRPPVEILGVGVHEATGFDLGAASSDAWPDAGPQRLYAFYPGSDTALVDLDQKRTDLLARGASVVATWGARALVRRGTALAVYDADARKETPLSGRTAADPATRQNGSVVVVAPLVVDLATPAVLGTVKGTPLAVARDGRVLVAAGDADATHLATGPLRWVTPDAK